LLLNRWSAESQKIAESGFDTVGYGAGGYGLGEYEAYGPKIIVATKLAGKFVGTQNAYGLHSEITSGRGIKKDFKTTQKRPH
jgi:hypothetical protein